MGVFGRGFWYSLQSSGLLVWGFSGQIVVVFEDLVDGEKLGQPHYAVPFLAPNTTGRILLHRVNYASGGGGIMNATGRIFVNMLSMDIQIDYFNITRKQIDKLLGASKARDFIMKKSIFSVTVGSNDFLNNYLLPVLSIGARVSESPDAFIDDFLNQFKGQLTVMRFVKLF
ncbi:hypothetical protein POM88_007508 [Heracleum sosnowskyi]|uniref:Uncharacterized protein n=1 Tax=Heracleum sosnowskyi TaxID=360622 RepID=A0AAD8J887_9APIA|nr:hypothetical protein POM88_007508 [Heracleum sosnowskyi]